MLPLYYMNEFMKIEPTEAPKALHPLPGNLHEGMLVTPDYMNEFMVTYYTFRDLLEDEYNITEEIDKEALEKLAGDINKKIASGGFANYFEKYDSNKFSNYSDIIEKSDPKTVKGLNEKVTTLNMLFTSKQWTKEDLVDPAYKKSLQDMVNIMDDIFSITKNGIVKKAA